MEESIKTTTGAASRDSGAMGFDRIRELLPHKEPFVLVDKVLELEENKRILCLTNVSGSAPWVPGHFPGFAIMPGALILEAMAQAALLLVLQGNPASRDKIGVFAGVRARFLEPVIPGDQLLIEVEIDKVISNGAVMSALARVENREVARATMTFGLRDKETIAR